LDGGRIGGRQVIIIAKRLQLGKQYRVLSFSIDKQKQIVDLVVDDKVVRMTEVELLLMNAAIASALLHLHGRTISSGPRSPFGISNVCACSNPQAQSCPDNAGNEHTPDAPPPSAQQNR
jgi:hypothetical protein